MSELVRSQLNIFFVMVTGGLAAGLVLEVFRVFGERRGSGKLVRALLELAAFAAAGFLISEFLFYCDNGKVSFEGIASFIAGLLLWKKCFCGILNPIGGNYGEEKFKRKSNRI